MADPAGKSALQEARGIMNGFKTEKNALIEQKKAMRSQLEQAKSQTDKLIKDKKDARGNVKFGSVEEINKEIAKLQRQQETTSMTLNEEKKILKEMDALQGSKKFVADLKNKDGALDSVKEQRKSIFAELSAKDKEIDALSEKINEVMVTLKAMNEKDSGKRDAIQGLFKERDEFRKQMGLKLKEKDAIRDDFRAKNNAWFNFQRGIRAQKQLQYEEEKKSRDEEKAAYEAKKEEEEAKKIPYEAEQALCDFLADYLERTYLSKPEDADADKDEKKDVIAVKDDPFAGFKAHTKKEGEEFFGKGKGKKKRVRAAKKQESGPFTISVDTFEQFGLIKMSPPTAVDQVAKSVSDLREKKEWYKQQPRGSVPTAHQIRKENEKAAAKLRQSKDAPAQSAPKNKGPSNFNLSKEEFAPLGAGGAASSVNSSWGQKSAAAHAL